MHFSSRKVVFSLCSFFNRLKFFSLHRSKQSESVRNKCTRCRIRSRKNVRKYLFFFLLSKLQKDERRPWTFPHFKNISEFSCDGETRDAGYQGYNFRNFHGVVNPRDMKSRNNEFVVN